MVLLGTLCDVLLHAGGSGSVAVEVVAMGFKLHFGAAPRSRARVFPQSRTGQKIRGAPQLLPDLEPMVRKYCSPDHSPSERRFAAITSRARW
jgi:hypothetical protein